jgi:hypothetical protein
VNGEITCLALSTRWFALRRSCSGIIAIVRLPP